MIFFEWKDLTLLALTLILSTAGALLLRSAGRYTRLCALSAKLTGTAMFALSLCFLCWFLIVESSNTNSRAIYAPNQKYAARTSTFVPFLGSGQTVVELYTAYGFKKQVAYVGLEQSVEGNDIGWLDDKTLRIRFDPTSNEDITCKSLPQVKVTCLPK